MNYLSLLVCFASKKSVIAGSKTTNQPIEMTHIKPHNFRWRGFAIRVLTDLWQPTQNNYELRFFSVIQLFSYCFSCKPLCQRTFLSYPARADL